MVPLVLPTCRHNGCREGELRRSASNRPIACTQERSKTKENTSSLGKHEVRRVVDIHVTAH